MRSLGSPEAAAGRPFLLWAGAPASPGRSLCPGWGALAPQRSLQAAAPTQSRCVLPRVRSRCHRKPVGLASRGYIDSGGHTPAAMRSQWALHQQAPVRVCLPLPSLPPPPPLHPGPPLSPQQLGWGRSLVPPHTALPPGWMMVMSWTSARPDAWRGSGALTLTPSPSAAAAPLPGTLHLQPVQLPLPLPLPSHPGRPPRPSLPAAPPVLPPRQPWTSQSPWLSQYHLPSWSCWGQGAHLPQSPQHQQPSAPAPACAPISSPCCCEVQKRS